MKNPALILSLILLTGLIGYAQEMCPMHRQGPREMEQFPPELLDDLSPEQKAKIDETRIEMRKNIIPIKAQIELKQIDLHKEMEADNPNKDRILKLSQEIHDLEWQIKKLNIEERLKIHSILTPEQREKLKMPRKKFIKKVEIEREERD
uniref:Periplasmic heavy metal sensor n=1 Tax=candidate division WOR-3 bacterium TaxID=2052148 RepID=A0A7C6AGT3_UNCW3